MNAFPILLAHDETNMSDDGLVVRTLTSMVTLKDTLFIRIHSHENRVSHEHMPNHQCCLQHQPALISTCPNWISAQKQLQRKEITPQMNMLIIKVPVIDLPTLPTLI